MEAYYEILSQCPLFTGITRQEMPEILNCLDKKVVEIPKGDPVFLEGEPARFVGVVLSGGVQIVRDDYYGNRSVLTVAAPGGLFAEAFVCAGLETLPVSAPMDGWFAFVPCWKHERGNDFFLDCFLSSSFSIFPQRRTAFFPD